MVNLLKSSGTLSVQDENIPIYTLNLTDGTGTPVALVNGTMVNFSYEPTNNFWQDQGYRWQDGYINVTKYGILSTPLGYYTMTDVENNFNTSGSPLMTFAESFGSVNYIINQSSGGNCSSLDLWATNISSSRIVHSSAAMDSVHSGSHLHLMPPPLLISQIFPMDRTTVCSVTGFSTAGMQVLVRYRLPVLITSCTIQWIQTGITGNGTSCRRSVR